MFIANISRTRCCWGLLRLLIDETGSNSKPAQRGLRVSGSQKEGSHSVKPIAIQGKEALCAINDSIRQINDRLTRTECSKEETGVWLQKIKTNLIDMVVPVIDKISPKMLAMSNRSPSNAKLNEVSPNSQNGAGN